jgi:hypothetical protein
MRVRRRSRRLKHYVQGAEGIIGCIGLAFWLVLGLAAGGWAVQSLSSGFWMGVLIGGAVATFSLWIVAGGHIDDYRSRRQNERSRNAERRLRLCDQCGSAAQSEYSFDLFHGGCPARRGPDHSALGDWVRDRLGTLNGAIDHFELGQLREYGIAYATTTGALSFEGRSANMPLYSHRDLIGEWQFTQGFEQVEHWVLAEDVARALVFLMYAEEPDLQSLDRNTLWRNLYSLFRGCGRLIWVTESQLSSLSIPRLPVAATADNDGQ